jgi:hypothetical protein
LRSAIQRRIHILAGTRNRRPESDWHLPRILLSFRAGSVVLANLEKDGKIKIVGSMYQLEGGRVEILS